jgi:N-acetylglucosamine-1-phosphate uridyltransferase (contains nucleotidyltransferase and I-patch acetyltransferase domains)
MLDRHGSGRAGGATPVRPAAALVLAAGDGTRMRSATPKVLHPIGGRSLLSHAVHAVAALEPEHLVVVVGHGGDRVRDAVAALGEELARPVLAAEQPHRMGTGHAVRCGLDALRDGLTGPVLVTYGDVPLLEPGTLAEMLHEHTASGAALTVLTTELADPTGYGRVRATAPARSPGSSSRPTPRPSSWRCGR